MKIKEILEVVLKEDNDITNMDGGIDSDLLGDEFEYLNIDWELKQNNPKITHKTHGEWNYDGRRYWDLSSYWFNNVPVLLLQKAGREGDDHKVKFILNKIEYLHMVEYIRSLNKDYNNIDDSELYEDFEFEDEKLILFYGNSHLGKNGFGYKDSDNYKIYKDLLKVENNE